MRKESGRWICILFLGIWVSLNTPPAAAQDFTNDDCLACHGDAEFWDLDDPEEAANFVHPASYEASIHAFFSCTDCHDSIEDVPHEPDLPDVECSTCHDDITETWLTSVHGVAHSGNGDEMAASCADCHGIHDMLPADNPASRIHHHNLAGTCISCHEDEALIAAHDLPTGETIDSYVFSVHGRANIDDPESKAATCSDCHGWHDILPSENPESRISRAKVAETCGECHTDVLEVYYGSVHGELAREGNPDVPVCTDCHGEHSILSLDNRQSTVSRIHIAETCGRCHEDPEIVEKYDIPISTPTTFYRASVHGRALLSGENENAAACQDCHGYHSILPGYHPDSSVNRMNTPDTCGQCHGEIEDEYLKSVHGKYAMRGVSESPVCNDCHGEHRILSKHDPESPVYPVRLAKEVCGRCHNSLVINRKFGLPEQQVETYFESYHGLASRLGDEEVANCASCHGVHLILPQEDPESMVNPANLLETCGSCHPGASPKFVEGLVHVQPERSSNPILAWVRYIYIVLIVLTIGGMLFHNLLIMFRHIADKYRVQKKKPHVKRFPKALLFQHLLLTVSFILLVITGFSLSYPESIFSRTMTNVFGLGEGLRGDVHRFAGVLLIGTALYHAGYTLFTRRGRYELKCIMLRFKDLRDSIQNVAFHLGLSRTKPKFDRFDYSEKMEYWALIWGTFIMVITGLVMWFPEDLSAWGVSNFWVQVAGVIHFYEAWLATLAIVVWHFFFVLFHPEEYPMALSWVTGDMPVESMKERHPLELERLIKEGKVLGGEAGETGEGAQAEH